MWTACFLLLHSTYQQFPALGHKVVINEPLQGVLVQTEGPLALFWRGLSGLGLLYLWISLRSV